MDFVDSRKLASHRAGLERTAGAPACVMSQATCAGSGSVRARSSPGDTAQAPGHRLQPPGEEAPAVTQAASEERGGLSRSLGWCVLPKACPLSLFPSGRRRTAARPARRQVSRGPDDDELRVSFMKCHREASLLQDRNPGLGRGLCRECRCGR